MVQTTLIIIVVKNVSVDQNEDCWDDLVSARIMHWYQIWIVDRRAEIALSGPVS